MRSKLEVPVSGAVITEYDKELLHEVVENGWYTDGKFHESFRQELKKVTKTRHFTLCSSGSSALLLATNACADFYESKKKGKRLVITPATGFPTTITPAIQAGFVPYFVDIDRKTLQIDYNTVLDLLSNKEVAGLVIAHTLGFPFAADLIAESIFSDQFFIEDCSDALGTKIKGFHVGSFADVSTFSFFPAHHITTGEGGAVGTNSGEMYRILESYNNWGRDCWCKPGESNTCNRRFSHHEYRLPYGYDHKYTFSRTGYNLKMTEFQAALGYSQLQRLDIIVESRLNNFNYLASALDYYEELDLIEWNYYLGNPSPFGFPIIVNEKANFTRKELVQFLESNGVRTRPLFAGNITRQPFMKNVNYATAGSLENSDYIMNNAFWIGCHDSLTKEQLDYTLEIFELFFKHREILN